LKNGSTNTFIHGIVKMMICLSTIQYRLCLHVSYSDEINQTSQSQNHRKIISHILSGKHCDVLSPQSTLFWLFFHRHRNVIRSIRANNPNNQRLLSASMATPMSTNSEGGSGAGGPKNVLDALMSMRRMVLTSYRYLDAPSQGHTSIATVNGSIHATAASLGGGDPSHTPIQPTAGSIVGSSHGLGTWTTLNHQSSSSLTGTLTGELSALRASLQHHIAYASAAVQNTTRLRNESMANSGVAGQPSGAYTTFDFFAKQHAIAMNDRDTAQVALNTFTIAAAEQQCLIQSRRTRSIRSRAACRVLRAIADELRLVYSEEGKDDSGIKVQLGSSHENMVFLLDIAFGAAAPLSSSTPSSSVSSAGGELVTVEETSMTDGADIASNRTAPHLIALLRAANFTAFRRSLCHRLRMEQLADRHTHTKPWKLLDEASNILKRAASSETKQSWPLTSEQWFHGQTLGFYSTPTPLPSSSLLSMVPYARCYHIVATGVVPIDDSGTSGYQYEYELQPCAMILLPATVAALLCEGKVPTSGSLSSEPRDDLVGISSYKLNASFV
jgi:hypothetical protein